jgi:hypothetical protein
MRGDALPSILDSTGILVKTFPVSKRKKWGLSQLQISTQRRVTMAGDYEGIGIAISRNQIRDLADFFFIDIVVLGRK